MTHLIRQQHLSVDFQGTEPELAALQRRLQRFCHDCLLPAMEITLDRHCTEEQHLYLERLDLEVGQLPIERLEYDLAGSITRALEKSLKEKLSRPRGAEQKSSQQALSEVFLYFLKTGSLPWWFRLPEGSDLEQVILRQWQKMDPSGTDSRMLREAAPRLLASASTRRRLVLQFSGSFLKKFLDLLAPGAAEAAGTVRLKLHDSSLPPAAVKQFLQMVWEAACEGLAEGGIASELDLVAKTWRRLADYKSARRTMTRELEILWPGVTRPMKGAIDPDTGNEPIVDKGAAPKKTSQCTDKIDRAADAAVTEGIYVDNAGLVLLHPFLPKLFEALQIAQGDKLLQHERAVCLLHHLATGSVKAPEYLVMLPKILCNIDLLTPVESDLALTSDEQEECLALLEAVIRHWGALGSCSPDALRGTFLLRPGKLTLRQDGEWLLQVEPSGCDILLDELPWSVSMIRLPWMGSMLWVEWT